MAWPGVGKHQPNGGGDGPRFGHEILEMCLVVKKVSWQMLLRIWKRDSRLGHGSWRGRVVWAGHGAHASLEFVPGSRFGLGLVAGDCVWEGVGERSSMFVARDS